MDQCLYFSSETRCYKKRTHFSILAMRGIRLRAKTFEATLSPIRKRRLDSLDTTGSPFASIFLQEMDPLTIVQIVEESLSFAFAMRPRHEDAK